MNDLERAHELLRSYGWEKGAMYSEVDGYCMAGALNATLGHPKLVCHLTGNLQSPDSWRILNQVAAEQFPERARSDVFPEPVFNVNDHPDTTWDDIEVIFEKASVRLSEFNSLEPALPDEAVPELVATGAALVR